VSLESSEKIIPSNYADIKTSLTAGKIESVNINIFEKSVKKIDQSKMFVENERKRIQNKFDGLLNSSSKYLSRVSRKKVLSPKVVQSKSDMILLKKLGRKETLPKFMRMSVSKKNRMLSPQVNNKTRQSLLKSRNDKSARKTAN
jgi:hypothetical protein